MTNDAADAAFKEAQRLHESGHYQAAHAAARAILESEPAHAQALELLALGLITRRREYEQGLRYIDRSVGATPDDAGVWYTRGWCYEYVAHEVTRQRGGRSGSGLEPKVLYETAADSFRRCLALRPEGKLLDDAADLLEHVENELSR